MIIIIYYSRPHGLHKYPFYPYRSAAKGVADVRSGD